MDGLFFLINILCFINFLFINVLSIPFEVYVTNTVKNSTSNPLYNTCFCDLIENSCDPFCCCDNYCNSIYTILGNKFWIDNNLCIPQPKTKYQKYFENCDNQNSTARIDDLFSPIRVFYQNIRAGFCIAYNNTGNYNQSLESDFSINDTESFTSAIYKYKNVNDTNQNSYLYFPNNFFKNIPALFENIYMFNNFDGYNPTDPLILINRQSETTKDFHKTFKLPISSPYGRCKNNLNSIRYLLNQDVICSYQLSYNSNNCLNFNSKNFPDDSNLILLSYNYTNNITTLVKPSINMYKVSNKFYYSQFPKENIKSSDFISFTKDGSKCSCKNIVTSVNYKFSVNNGTIVGYNITYILEDFNSDCDSREFIPIKYKVQFLNDDIENYLRSGNPGYLKGKPIISGTSQNINIFNVLSGMNNTYTYVEQYNNPRLIYGIGQEIADRGKCYHTNALYGIDESIVFNDNSATTPINSQILPFFNLSILNSPGSGVYTNPLFDNIITYEDNISWGCADKLNITGLKYYCTNQLWKQKMIFQVFKNISYIAQFGNPNRHFLLDWITIDPFTIDSYQSFWDETLNKCTIPAVFNIDILYASYGAVNNTQEGIFKVQYRLDYLYWYGKNNIDRNVKNNFLTYININFFKVPQDTVMWYAPGPGFIQLPRNILYPFKIGTTTYGIISSVSKSISYNLVIIFICLIFLI